VSDKFSIDLTDEQFKSITINALADMQAEFVVLRSFILQRIAKLGGETDEAVYSQFKKELKSARADVLANFLTKYGR